MPRINDVYQQELDEIALRQRGNSPRFPTIVEALERRQRARETVAARLFIGCFFAALVSVHWMGWQFGAVAAAVAFVGFAAVCFVAGSRHDKRQSAPLDKAIDDFCEG